MEIERLLLLSGAVSAGKTSVANALITTFHFKRISSSEYLRSLLPLAGLPKADDERTRLQELGDRLDEETDFLWVVDPVAVNAITDNAEITSWLIDAVRKKRQVEHFRQRFGSIVRHIHLKAPESVLRARYIARGGNYDQAVTHPNEMNARGLEEIADLVLDTAHSEPVSIAARISVYLGE